jgi:signal transduction histidine kinase/ActR/RegA family two-component response regulator
MDRKDAVSPNLVTEALQQESTRSSWFDRLHHAFAPIDDPANPADRASPEFDAYCLLRSRQLTQLGLVCAMATMFVMAVSDFVVFGDSTAMLGRMLAFRAGLVAFCIVMFAVLNRLDGSALVIPTAIGLYLVICAVGFGFMGTLGGPERPFIFTAFMMPAFPAGLLRVPLRTRAWATGAGTVVMLAAYFGPHPGYFANRNNAFLLALLGCTAAGTVLAGDAFYRLERIAFHQRLAMARHAERLTELNRLKDAFLGTVSHELRTPLTAILGLTEVVARRPTDPNVPFYLKTVLQAGESLLTIINDLLDLTRIKADKLVLRPVPTDVCAIVAQVLHMLGVEASRKELRLTGDVPQEMPLLLLDGNRLQQILVNLVGNALKFTSEGGVHVAVGLQDSWLEIRVSDTGPGIPPEEREAVFSEFVQLEKAPLHVQGGSGLGLAVVRRLVELLGGKVHIEGNAPTGSVFVVRLPAIPATPMPQPVPVLSPPVRLAPQLLVADDLPETRLVMEAFARQAGVQIDVVRDGEEALWLFTADRYDLVLLDIHMPRMDGFTAVRAMRALEREKGRAPSVIVALTAHSGSEYGPQAQAAGFTWHLTKPFRLADFQQLLERYGIRFQRNEVAAADRMPAA